jgi:hypothetical protein
MISLFNVSFRVRIRRRLGALHNRMTHCVHLQLSTTTKVPRTMLEIVRTSAEMRIVNTYPRGEETNAAAKAKDKGTRRSCGLHKSE